LKNPTTKQFSGKCFVDFATLAESKKAVDMSGRDFNGRELKVKYSSKGPKTPIEPRKGKSDGLIKSRFLKAQNLDPNLSENDLDTFFQDFKGTFHPKTKLHEQKSLKENGFVVIQFKCIAEAENTKSALNGKSLKGKAINLDWHHDTKKNISQLASKQPRINQKRKADDEQQHQPQQQQETVVNKAKKESPKKRTKK